MKLLIILTIFNLSAEALKTIRTLYNSAIDSEISSLKLDEFLKSLNVEEPLILGYTGANKMLLAKYAVMPNQKYAYFSEGRQKLDKAIGLEPSNLELRYLRYSIQLNSPYFLGYNKNTIEDRAALINGTSGLSDHDLKVKIISFLVVSGKLSEAERGLLK